MLGGHVRAVFTLVTVIFIICVSATVTSFREIPLWKLEASNAAQQPYSNIDGEQPQDEGTKTYGSVNQHEAIVQDQSPMVITVCCNSIYAFDI